MIIKKTQNNQSIIKQLIVVLNNALDNSLDDTMNSHKTIGAIKKSDQKKVIMEEAILIVEFIDSWTFEAYYNFLGCYALLMRHNDKERFFGGFMDLPYSKTAFEARHNSYSDGKKKPLSPLFEKTIIPLTMRVKEHNGSIEDSLLAVVKPFLVEEFVSALTINELETTLELLSVVDHYNDYDYQLERFISVLEENLVKQGENETPLELLGVWWLDETFLKNTIIPELKKRTLTDEQKETAAIHNSCKELINNYYDYSLYCVCAKTDYALTTEFVDTFFFYEKAHFDQAVSIMRKALLANPELDEKDVEWEFEWLLDRTTVQKPERVESLRELLSS